MKCSKVLRVLGLVFLFVSGLSFANDGAFYMRGNQLIPLHESAISIKKEVLMVKRIEGDYLQVTVAYVFDNPSEEKELLVGFEAPSPQGDVNGMPINGSHPYITNFSVIMNGFPLMYEAALVQDSTAYLNGIVTSISVADAISDNADVNYVDFYYVYHFKASFKKGLNTILHTYNFKLSSSVMEAFSFDYILTAANRWANNGIDDFTLIIDLGPFQDVLISRSFFDAPYTDWTLDGKILDAKNDLPAFADIYQNPARFISKSSPLIYSKKNFHPTGELMIACPYDFSVRDIAIFDATTHALPFTIESTADIHKSLDENSYKILRNLPFARRGYIFKTEFIQAYYEKQAWYLPNPGYRSSEHDLTVDEKEWLKLVNEAGF